MRRSDPPIKTVREWLGLDITVFAMAIGVHMSSAYRWESSSKEPSGLHKDILDAALVKMEQIPRAKRVAEGKRLGEAVRAALISHGTLGSLAVLLTYITENQT